MSDILIRSSGHAGRITLNRPQALNALTYEMAMQIDAALQAWDTDPQIARVIIDATGDKAFCAGGDIAQLYSTGRAGDFSYGRRFWRDEYRMNARLAGFAKPVISFMQGFTMGGGVGVGCHGRHRIVGHSSQIAMPEVGIGLVPDVGGSALLARAPGQLGAYLGTTASRMGAGDAILAGFADYFVPETAWPALIEALCTSPDLAPLEAAKAPPPPAPLKAIEAQINTAFASPNLPDILAHLSDQDSEFAQNTLKSLGRNSPLAMACALEMVRRLQSQDSDMRTALELEYRYTFRAMEHSDFLEGIRAAIIDKDRNPKWRHALHQDMQADIQAMLAPLGADTLTFEQE